MTPLGRGPYTACLRNRQSPSPGKETMRSERRHELQTNALAEWIGEAIERIRPYQTDPAGRCPVGGDVGRRRRLVAASFGGPDRRRVAGDASRQSGPVVQPRGTAIRHAGRRFGGPCGGRRVLCARRNERFVNRAASNDALAKATNCYQRVLAADASPIAQSEPLSAWLACWRR